MSHSITIRLQNPAQEFDAGTSVGFRVKGGVKYFDNKEKKENYTNYEAALFVAKSNASQVDYYRRMLVANSIVEISAKEQAIRTFEGQQGTKYYIELINASAGFMGLGAEKQQSNQPQQGFNNQPQQGYANNQPQQGFNNQPQQGYANNQPQQGYANNQPQQGFNNQQQGNPAYQRRA